MSRFAGETDTSRYLIAAWCLVAVALPGVLVLHLLPALLAGLLVFELAQVLATRLPQRLVCSSRSRAVAVAILVALVVLTVALGILGGVAFFRSEAGSLSALLGKMAEIVEGAREKLPTWLAASLPDGAEEIRAALSAWLRTHSSELQTWGKETGLAAAHVLIGIVIGAMVVLHEMHPDTPSGPLAQALFGRLRLFGEAFRRIVFAQVKISAVNSLLTGVYLVLVLPLLGIHLPLTKTLIAVTFLVGLIPVLGNLLSNTAIVIVSLSHSLEAAAASLGFLVVIHKLEYFLNARIVGAGVGAHAWELLTAMLVMESLFGVPGVVAAPIFYAYLKSELVLRKLI